jgi:hypothetical protein
MGGHEERKDTPVDRESTYRALMRDVILGTLAVVFVSLAVPAWILRVEYRKSFATPTSLAPAAEILRDRASPSVPPRRPDILELAERLVRQEAERRTVERRAAERRAAERAAAQRRAAEGAPPRGSLPPPARPGSFGFTPLPIEIPQSP